MGYSSLLGRLKPWLSVIASEAKQSRDTGRVFTGLLRRDAPRNDGYAVLENQW
jgi:hypothetical protein